MLFNSLDFLLWLPVLLLAYGVLPGRHLRVRQAVLLAASYLFYGYFDARFLLVLWASTAIDFVAARQIAAAGSGTRRKIWLASSLATNLGLLIYFKYAGFFVESAAALLEALHMPYSPLALQVVMPVGISFYTFQTLGYTLDVYRGRIAPERSPLAFALFVAFFPQLMAGPIERASDLLPQLRRLPVPAWSDVRSGVRWFLLGLVKKVVISTALYEHASGLYLNPDLRSTPEAWVLSSLILIHIYMDFSGYSDMAVGLGRMLGIRLSANFDRVTAARNAPDLWRRWHRTLGRWFRDYVLLPLSRAGVPRRMAIFMTFSAVGLWHGAQWTYVVWGMLMGGMWLFDDATRWQERVTFFLPPAVARRVQTLLTLTAFLFICQLFAVPTLADGATLMRTLLGFPSPFPDPFTPLPRAVLLACGLFFALEFFPPLLEDRLRRFPHWNTRWVFVRDVVVIPVALALCAEGLLQSREFVYFQF